MNPDEELEERWCEDDWKERPHTKGLFQESPNFILSELSKTITEYTVYVNDWIYYEDLEEKEPPPPPSRKPKPNRYTQRNYYVPHHMNRKQFNHRRR